MITIYGAVMDGREAHLVRITAERVDAGGLTIVGLDPGGPRETTARVYSAIEAAPDRWGVLRLHGARVVAERLDGKMIPPTTALDLPIALAVVALNGAGQAALARTLAIGELTVAGEVWAPRGVIPLVELATTVPTTAGEQVVIIGPSSRRIEIAVGAGTHWAPSSYAVTTLWQAIGALSGTVPEAVVDAQDPIGVHVDSACVGSLSDAQRAIRYQALAAIENGGRVLLVGQPGAGKTVIARTLISGLTPLLPRAAREVARVQSMAGLLWHDWTGHVTRPFRAPHYTLRTEALAGTCRRIGEADLACWGVLLLDDLVEFSREAIADLGRRLQAMAREGRAPAVVATAEQVDDRVEAQCAALGVAARFEVKT